MRTLEKAQLAKREKAERLDAEVRRIAGREGIEVVSSSTKTISARREDERRLIVVDVRGVSSYLDALHELGHHLAPRAWGGTRLQRESAAWLWAIDNAGEQLTLGARRGALRKLYSYGFWVADRQYRRRSRPLMPGEDFYAAAAAICGRSRRLVDEERQMHAELAQRAERARSRRTT